MKMWICSYVRYVVMVEDILGTVLWDMSIHICVVVGEMQNKKGRIYEPCQERSINT